MSAESGGLRHHHHGTNFVHYGDAYDHEWNGLNLDDHHHLGNHHHHGDDGSTLIHNHDGPANHHHKRYYDEFDTNYDPASDHAATHDYVLYGPADHDHD